MSIRTRFAPSPTGYLHIGGVRTALFNWLLSRRHGGQFILRIDDTDTERNRAEALQPILDGFRWLGMQWDEGAEVGGPYGPYYQSQKLDHYRAQAMRLLEAGNAYPDYTPPEVSDAARKAAKGQYVHRGENRDKPPADNVKAYADKPAPLRLKIPLGTTSVIDDLICGKVEMQTDLLGDPVILRADGRALYNFASVVDDIDVKITHVIRAREHLGNTHTQQYVFRFLGAELPRFAHVPVVNEPGSKKKLSKRDMAKFVTEEVKVKLRLVGYTDEEIAARDDLNPATVAFYRELGYLPAAVVNYLARLGWSMDGESEYIPLDVMVANFSLDRVNDSPASFDPDKLYWLAGEYMQKLPFDEKVAGCLPFLTRAKLISDPPSADELALVGKVVELAGPRLKLFSDILVNAPPFLRREITYHPDAVAKAFKKAGAADHLNGFAEMLRGVEPFDAEHIRAGSDAFCSAKGIKFNDVQMAVRVAATGTNVGVGLFETLELLGKAESLRRIDAAPRG